MWALLRSVLLGRFRCSKCGEMHDIRRCALRSPFRARIAVCRDCLRLWDRTGHRCGECWHPIQTTWDLGLLVERGVFAHVDCGAALLLPVGPGGRFALPSSIPIGHAIGRPASVHDRREGSASGAEPAAALSPEQ